MRAEGFTTHGTWHHPIQRPSSQKLLEQGVYAVGFFFPVVAKGKARIRTQISAAHTKEDLDTAISAFKKTYNELTNKL